MSIADRTHRYKRLAESEHERVDYYKKRLSANSIFRFLAFAVGVLLVYLFFEYTLAAVFIAAVCMFCFLALILRHNLLSGKKARAEVLEKIANHELKAFEYDFSAFDGAARKINPAHDFSFDLDIFGERSVFQLLNRTALPLGKNRLVDYLENPLHNGAHIRLRQQAVSELAQKEDFCLNFRVLGILSDGVFSSVDEVKNTFTVKPLFAEKSIWNLLTILVPFVYLFYFILIFTGALSAVYLPLLYFITLGLSSVPLKKTKTIWQTFDKKSKMLSGYAQLFRLVETAAFDSAQLKQLQATIMGAKAASENIGQLARHIRNLDQAFAVPVLLLLNPLFLWNVLYALKVEKWIAKHGLDTGKWFGTLAETDALISLGTFAANNPDFTFPETADHFVFTGKNMGHPLIPREKCVKNDININRKPYFMIVTGANMAGKSTYLRTVGVNFVLASIGAPVCADKLVFYPGKLLTNLRTADSLVNNESYFFAELKRLKMIIEELQSGKEGLFIILDEILKGTNSEDKQKGSFALMKRLVQLGGNGIIATHDLALGELETEFPDAIRNYHFDTRITDDALSFDYRLHNGIAKNMNANFLMKKMDII